MRPFFLLTLASACLLGLANLAQSASPTIDVASIRPGMKGYGLTVFRGSAPERFDVEVIDVLHRFRPAQDLILIRTTHPILEKALVVGGMSGSPIYLDNKLAGAYAYGWTFAKEPIAGVTPIANMLAEMTRPFDPGIWRALGIAPVASAAAADKRANRKQPPAQHAGFGAELAPGLAAGQERGAFNALRAHAFAGAQSQDVASAPSANAAPRLVPASTPLMVSGFDERVVSLLDAELSRFGMPAVEASAGGGTSKPTAGAHYVDGGAIGVQLMRGDAQITAIGTVTHVAGQRLVAFGHPMMNGGQPALPTATARVLHILASEQRSFKIAEAQAPLGAMVHDRQAAIVIDTSVAPVLVPMAVRVHGATFAPKTEWKMELASHRLMTPMLSFSAILNALSATVAEQTDVVFEAKSRVRIAGHGTFEVTDVGYTPVGVGTPSAIGQLRVLDLVSAAYMNPFEQARVEGIEIDLTLRFARDLVQIVDAMVPAGIVDPGRDVNVYVTLRRFGAADETKIVPVHVPMSAAGEKLEIAFEPGNQVRLEQPKADNLDQILRNVQEGFSATSLVVSTKLPSQGLSMRGHVVRNLPGSMLDTLQSTAESDSPTAFATQARTEIPMAAVVTGSARVKLEVRAEPLH